VLGLRRDNGKLEYGLGAFVSLGRGTAKKAREIMVPRSFLGLNYSGIDGAERSWRDVSHNHWRVRVKHQIQA